MTKLETNRNPSNASTNRASDYFLDREICVSLTKVSGYNILIFPSFFVTFSKNSQNLRESY